MVQGPSVPRQCQLRTPLLTKVSRTSDSSGLKSLKWLIKNHFNHEHNYKASGYAVNNSGPYNFSPNAQIAPLQNKFWIQSRRTQIKRSQPQTWWAPRDHLRLKVTTGRPTAGSLAHILRSLQDFLQITDDTVGNDVTSHQSPIRSRCDAWSQLLRTCNRPNCFKSILKKHFWKRTRHESEGRQFLENPNRQSVQKSRERIWTQPTKTKNLNRRKILHRKSYWKNLPFPLISLSWKKISQTIFFFCSFSFISDRSL